MEDNIIDKELIEDFIKEGIELKYHTVTEGNPIPYIDTFCNLDMLMGLIENQRARERESLIKYAKHRNDSEVFCESLKHSDYACTCGLDEMLSATNQHLAEQETVPKERQAVPDGFNREDIETCLIWLEEQELTVNVGNVTGLGDDLIESSAGYLLRLMRAMLSAAPAQPQTMCSNCQGRVLKDVACPVCGSGGTLEARIKELELMAKNNWGWHCILAAISRSSRFNSGMLHEDVIAQIEKWIVSDDAPSQPQSELLEALRKKVRVTETIIKGEGMTHDTKVRMERIKTLIEVIALIEEQPK